jgi:GT2 family glycosyltransferase
MPLGLDPIPRPVHSFQPLGHPLVFDQPRRLSDVDSWHEHIPFAFFAVAALRPQVLVELGTRKGDSYCAFCQAVQALGLPTRCYAVDTWKGDEHTGPYSPETLEELRAYHDPLYGSFSRLLQQTFDEAATHFAEGSVDLLHVDGCHAYEAVAHDVVTWLPKLSERAVVLLHDTNVRESGFGVWRLWEELSRRYPGFAFPHGHGLGVLAVGSRVDAEFLDFLEAAEREPLASRFFSALGSRIALPARERRARAAFELDAERRIHTADEARAAAESDAERRVQAADEARAAAELEAEERLDAANRSRAESERRQLERDRVETQLRAREADLAGVVRSASWRITTPLRTAKRNARRARRAVRRFRRPNLSRGYASSSGIDADEPAAAASPRRRRESPLLHRPLVSIVTPVFNTDPEWLGRAVESVRGQTYPHWQLCLADDGSTNERTLEYLRGIADDSAIDVLYGNANRGIAAASNRALEAAAGEFVAFLDHDDELDPDALLECIRLLNEKPQTDAIYTDEDKINRRGARSEPFFKPDWSPEFFRGVMYVGHLLVLRRSLVESVGGLDSTFDGVQDYELMLRVSEHTDRIEHIPRILYHWRKLPGSVASSIDAKEGISELQAAAVNRHLERCEIQAVARPSTDFPHRAMLHPKPRAHWPRVTVIVPTKDAPDHLARCLGSIFDRSTYPNFGVLLVDNGTTDPEARRVFDRYPVDVLPFDGPFNFSCVNNVGVERADGDFVVFLNNDTDVQTPEWLEAMVGLAELEGVGAVGPLLLYPNGTVQHAGVVLGLRGTADHIMRRFPSTSDGYAGSLSCTREVSAVTAACMLVRRELFLELGAFDEHFATHYQDVDLCLRIRRSGRRILYTPRAVLRHHESATRGVDYDHLDRALLLDAWGETIARGDPFYNPFLSLSGADYQPRAAAA